MKARSIRFLAALAALMLLAAACAEEEASTDEEAETDEEGEEHPGGATDVGVTEDTIRVSQIVSLTGDNAAGQVGFELGFEAYIEALNEAGGVHGRTIEIVDTYDDNSTAERQREEFVRTVEQDEVFLVVGSWPFFGAADYAAENQIPTVGAPYSDEWHYSDAFFGVSGGSWEAPDPENIPTPAGATAAIDAYIMAKQGDESFGVFSYTQTASARGAQTTCENVEQYGIDCAYSDSSLEFGFTDLGASIQAIRDSGATHFYAAMDIGGCATILRSWLRAGLDDYTLRCAVGYGQEAIDNFSDLIENMYVLIGNPPFDSDHEEMTRFVTELTTRKPGQEPSTTTLNGWLAGIFIEDVLTELGPNVTRERFIETARSAEQFSNWDGNGLITGIDWTTNRHVAAAEPDFAPDPDICGGFLLRPDVDAGTWVQVGQKPKLCLAGATDAESLADVVAEDDSSLEVG